MINLNKFSLLVGHNYWKKSKNQTKKNGGPLFKRMEAYHSKDHRRIDFEPLVTEEEVRRPGSSIKLIILNINFLHADQRQFDTNAQLN